MDTKHTAIMHPIKQRNMMAAYDGHDIGLKIGGVK